MGDWLGDMLREKMGRANAPTTTTGDSPLAAAMGRLDAAKAGGDQARIEEADLALNVELERVRSGASTGALNDETQPVPDFDAAVAGIGPVGRRRVQRPRPSRAARHRPEPASGP